MARLVMTNLYLVAIAIGVINWYRNVIPVPRRKEKPYTKAKFYHDHVGRRFQRVAVDITGEFPELENCSKYILVICDRFTKMDANIPIT